MKRLTTVILGCFLFFSNGNAQDANALEILGKVNEAVNQIKTIQYSYTYDGWGKVAGKFDGEVKISKEQGLQLRVDLNTIDKNGGYEKQESIYTNGDSLRVLDKTEKNLRYGTASGGSAYLMSYAWYAVFREHLMPPDPFSKNFSDSTMKYEGIEKISDKECHVISMNNPWGDRNFWYFGTKDYHIYGQRQENNQKDVEGGFKFEVIDLTINESIDPVQFSFSISNDVTKSNENERIIAVGEEAPDWTLKSGSNQNISSRDLKGKIILLDFWASWCSPCWKIMPVIDEIKAEYSGKGVEVFGVNVWENPNLDINEYLVRKELNHYEVLFDVDASIAKSFKIASLPLIVIIGRDGKILYHNNGVDREFAVNIRKILDEKTN